MKRLHPDLTWPAPHQWVEDEHWSHSLSDLAPLVVDGEIRGLQSESFEVLVSAEPRGAFRIRLASREPARQTYRVDDRVLAAGRAAHPLTGESEGSSVAFRQGEDVLRLGYPTLRITLERDGSTALRMTRLLLGQGDNSESRRLEFARFASGPILGLGGRLAFPDRAGTTADLFATKGYHDRGDYGGFPIPAILELGTCGVVLLNPHPHVYADFGYTDSQEWTLDVPGGPVDLIVLAQPSPHEWVQFLHELTGRPPMPRPQWFGTWFSYTGYSSSQEYLEWIQQFQAHDIPLDVWAFDIHWRAGSIFDEDEAGDGVNLDWDPVKFATHDQVMSLLESRQIDSVLHVNTRMYSGDLAEEGKREGFLLDATEKQWIVDLENAAAADWAWTAYAKRMAEGATSWWIDNSERVEGMLSSGVPARNYYSSLWNRYLTERVTELTGEPVLTLTRGGWLGDQTAALPWSGDTTAGVSRIKEDLNFVLNLAMTGFPFTSVDLGGFKEQKPSGKGVIDTDENVIRRIAHAFMFMPVPRLHSGLFTQPKLPWRYESPVNELLAYYIRLRHRLLPTYFSAAIDAAEHGSPMVRPLLFDFPEDEASHGVFDEVLVGRALLIAPVTDEGWAERTVYLPPGPWFDYWTNRRFNGGRSYLMDAPLYETTGLPILVRAGGILGYRPPSRPREGLTDLTLALYADASTTTLATSLPEDQHFGSAAGSRLTVLADWTRNELTLRSAGAESWRIDVDFPVTTRTPTLTDPAGGAVSLPLVVPGGSSVRVSIRW